MPAAWRINFEEACIVTPALRIDGIKADVVALYERLRKATEEEKRRRGVRVLDAERVA